MELATEQTLTSLQSRLDLMTVTFMGLQQRLVNLADYLGRGERADDELPTALMSAYQAFDDISSEIASLERELGTTPHAMVERPRSLGELQLAVDRLASVQALQEEHECLRTKAVAVVSQV